MRAFLAVELSEDQRAHLAELGASVRAGEGARVLRWVKPPLLHITLAFFPDLEAARERDIERRLPAALAGLAPFSLRLGGVGAYPRRRAPRVLWIGLECGTDTFCELHARVAAALAECGCAQENRAPSPHVTLARVRRPPRGEAGEFHAARALLEQLHEEASRRPGPPAVVTGVTLFESELRAGGPRYTPRARIEFDARC